MMSGESPHGRTAVQGELSTATLTPMPCRLVQRFTATPIDACSRHLFEFAAEIPSLLAGTLEVPSQAPAAPRQGTLPVSYTHLTLPTICSV